MDYEQLAAELLRALRGTRSQTAFSRRLGYRCNVSYTWEAKRRFPTAAGTLRGAERVGIDVHQAIHRFVRRPPAWLDEVDPASPEGVARLLQDLRGDTPIVDVAERIGRSRFAVSRWLRGGAEPRLPDFLSLVEATSLRLLDFLSHLVDPSDLPSVTDAWRRLEAARSLTHDTPWAPAVLLSLQLADYTALPAHEDGWIARRIGFSPAMEQRCLSLLADAGQIRWSGGRWHVRQVQAVDTRRADGDTSLKQWWAQVGLDRLAAGSDGLFSYNLFTVSDADFQRLVALQRAHYRTMRGIIATSEPGERIALVNLQLLALDVDAP